MYDARSMARWDSVIARDDLDTAASGMANKTATQGRTVAAPDAPYAMRKG